MVPSARVRNTQPYLFHQIDVKKAEAIKKGIDVISLAIGDPDRPTPAFVLDLMDQEMRDPKNHVYPSYKGEPDFFEMVARWFQGRFGVELDPAKEIMATIGAKDAVSHLPFAFLDPGDTGIYTDPGYPVYSSAMRFAGADVVQIPIRAENGFLPDLDAISPELASKAKIMFVNYPNNPTSAVADEGFFRRLVAFALKHDIVILSDNAYSEVYFDDADRPISIMKIEGARECAIEIHSFSKTFNMTGWRMGFVTGGQKLIDDFFVLKSNFDSGVFMAIQRAAARALLHPDAPAFHAERTALFKNRRDRIAEALRDAGFEFSVPRASYYFWVKVPENFDSSVAFAADLLNKTGVSVTPGVGYGPNGEGWFRVSMTAPDHRIDQAMERISKFVKDWA